MGQKPSRPAASASSARELTIESKTRSYPVYGKNIIMRKKRHGTSDTPVMSKLRWGCDVATADRICNKNRHFAEHSGYFQRNKKFLKAIELAKKNNEKLHFYDSNNGLLLFQAPHGRTFDEWIKESKRHGWPSFRDEEVNWQYVRCLKNGETVSLHGTHLGHNLPDHSGNRYCINLVSVAGNAAIGADREQQLSTWPELEDSEMATSNLPIIHG